MKTNAKVNPKKKGVKMEQLAGYLFARLHAIGSKSEGPMYYLQLWDEKEVLLPKKVKPWQNDPVLHAWLGKKVVVYGKSVPVEMDGEPKRAFEYHKLLNADQPLLLDLKLGLKEDTFWINKMPPGNPPKFPPKMRKLKLKLSVQWPYRQNPEEKRSVWKGECPTSQLYDFWIENPKGKTIWQWSKCMHFREELTPVSIPGGSPKRAKVRWHYFEDAITMEGTYVVQARFIASEQEIRKAFNVKFAV